MRVGRVRNLRLMFERLVVRARMVGRKGNVVLGVPVARGDLEREG